MSAHEMTISADGISFIYSDELRGFLKLGRAEIKRVSHVEPDTDGRWIADLSPVNGPQLGPFDLRSDALNAEVEWLKENVL